MRDWYARSRGQGQGASRLTLPTDTRFARNSAPLRLDHTLESWAGDGLTRRRDHPKPGLRLKRVDCGGGPGHLGRLREAEGRTRTGWLRFDDRLLSAAATGKTWAVTWRNIPPAPPDAGVGIGVGIGVGQNPSRQAIAGKVTGAAAGDVLAHASRQPQVMHLFELAFLLAPFFGTMTRATVVLAPFQAGRQWHLGPFSLSLRVCGGRRNETTGAEDAARVSPPSLAFEGGQIPSPMRNCLAAKGLHGLPPPPPPRPAHTCFDGSETCWASTGNYRAEPRLASAL